MRTGSADMLGGHLIDSAITWGQALPLVRSPLDYLRARCGVACLDAAWKLLGVLAVIVNDLALGRQIHRLVRKPPLGLPKILLKERSNGLR